MQSTLFFTACKGTVTSKFCRNAAFIFSHILHLLDRSTTTAFANHPTSIPLVHFYKSLQYTSPSLLAQINQFSKYMHIIFFTQCFSLIAWLLSHHIFRGWKHCIYILVPISQTLALCWNLQWNHMFPLHAPYRISNLIHFEVQNVIPNSPLQCGYMPKSFIILYQLHCNSSFWKQTASLFQCLHPSCPHLGLKRPNLLLTIINVEGKADTHIIFVPLKERSTVQYFRINVKLFIISSV